ncbi:MAG: hypothetical protein LQ346_000538 [Caloplaca aetnensis]|nr:MAG: hypothetical protein LQ346_000538 [Caloplaca aetnensis]
MAGSEATYPVKISFGSLGACPPVYVAGSFTVPEWQPQELNYSVNESDEDKVVEQPSYTFSRTFDVPVGTFQYKFRLGQGDWWVCGGNEVVVTDALGNHNNRLVVAPEPQDTGDTPAEVTHEEKEPALTNPKGDWESAKSTGPSGPEGDLTLRRRTDQSNSPSAACSMESKESSEPPLASAESILQWVFRWLKSFLILRSRRKVA